eukprot:scaffold94_cov340-Prasinococcus_capsulatus_cf.AAC.17
MLILLGLISCQHESTRPRVGARDGTSGARKEVHHSVPRQPLGSLRFGRWQNASRCWHLHVQAHVAPFDAGLLSARRGPSYVAVDRSRGGTRASAALPSPKCLRADAQA